MQKFPTVIEKTKIWTSHDKVNTGLHVALDGLLIGGRINEYIWGYIYLVMLLLALHFLYVTICSFEKVNLPLF